MIRPNHHLSLVSRAALAALFALPLMGCYVEARTAGPPPPPSGEVVVEADPPPPPPPQVEVQPAPPGAEFFWVGGYHRWDGHRYVWVGGRYERRPHANARWTAAHWERRGNARVFIEGRWD
jgi:hypothetical protein